MDALPRPIEALELLDLSRSGLADADFSPLSEHKFLLVSADASGLTSEETAQVTSWLQQRPCPVLALGAGTLAEAADVVLNTAAQALPLIDNIRRHPMAAAALVQLLRLTDGMPMDEALTVESLTYTALQSGPEFRQWLDTRDKPQPKPQDEPGPAVVMQRQGNALQLELNRPANRNAMSVEMRDALVEALQLVLADDSIQQVQISGRGKCFSTGGDLTEFGTLPDPATAHFVRALAVPGRYLARCADRVSVRLHGACVGSGIEFPAFAGRVTASADAWFQLPELRFGLIPGAGGCISMARRMGRQRTAWLALSGERLSAPQALAWGLVDAVEG